MPTKTGGRPNTRLPVRLKTAMKDAGLDPKWQTLADLFDCQYNNTRKLVYERKYESVRQFLQAAAVLRLTPRDLLEIMDDAKKDAKERKKCTATNTTQTAGGNSVSPKQ